MTGLVTISSFPLQTRSSAVAERPRDASVTEYFAKSLNGVKKVMIRLAVLTEYRRVIDGQTDGQTNGHISCHGIVRAMHACRAVKISPYKRLQTCSIVQQRQSDSEEPMKHSD